MPAHPCARGWTSTYDGAVTTIFTKIINGDIPGTFVHRDDVCVAFVDINPINRGHVLVVPIVEVDHWLDLPDWTVAHLTSVAQRIGKAQQAAFGGERVGLMIAGFDVPHTHLHVVPMDNMGHLSFANASPNTPEDREAVAAEIMAHLKPSG